MNIKQINTFTKKQVKEEMLRAKKEHRNHFIFKHKLFDGSIKKVIVHSYPIKYNNKQVLFSIIHESTNKSLASQFNNDLNTQVDIQTKQLKQSKQNLIIIFTIIRSLEYLIITK